MNINGIGSLGIKELLGQLINNEDGLPKLKLLEVEPTNEFFFEQSGLDLSKEDILKALIEVDGDGDFAIRVAMHTTSGSTRFTKSELSEMQIMRNQIGKTDTGKAYLRLTSQSACCNPNVYGYVKKFTLDTIVVTPTGDPDIYDVSVDVFALNRVFTGSILESAIIVLDKVAGAPVLQHDYLADPVANFTFQAEKNGDGDLIFKIFQANKTNDGMYFVGYFYATVAVGGVGDPVITKIQIEDLSIEFVCNDTMTITAVTNIGTSTIMYHDLEFDNSEDVDRIVYTTPVSTPPGIQGVEVYNSILPPDTENLTDLAQFASTCNGPVTFINPEWFCEGDTMQIRVGAYGLNYGDTVIAEASNDGGVTWSTVYEFPNPNGTNQEEDRLAWDHTLFPEGQEVIIRIVSTELGVLESKTVTVTTCI